LIEQYKPTVDTTSYPKYRNDDGVAEIRIGTRQFHCIGASPPHDHPHIYLNMGELDFILCPYCSTLFRFDSQLESSRASPVANLYIDP
jgi:uncharacterized Zn-finger protein